MQGQYWKKSVLLEFAGAGTSGIRTVTSTDDAARCLLYKWPDQSSKAYHRAKGMCLDALEGRQDHAGELDRAMATLGAPDTLPSARMVDAMQRDLELLERIEPGFRIIALSTALWTRNLN